MTFPFSHRIALLVVAAALAGWMTAAHPLAAQPTQPEATQFEPVDVTDVVNLTTGDLAYTVPLIEVPGPEGSYPVALSYHSGVGPNQQATWVGLGWTLNAGAINRTAVGYPDEYAAAPVYTTYDGKGKKSYSISVGVYYGVPYGSVGLNMSYEVNSGMLGVNAVAMVMPSPSGTDSQVLPSIGISAGTSGLSATAGLGQRGGGGNVGLRVSAGAQGLQGSVSGGYSMNVGGAEASGTLSAGADGLSFSGSGGVSSESGSSVGFSLSSNGVSAEFSPARGASISLTAMGSGEMTSSGFSIPIPTPSGFTFTIGFSQRQWILQQRETNATFGYSQQGTYLCATQSGERREAGVGSLQEDWTIDHRRGDTGNRCGQGVDPDEIDGAKYERQRQDDILYATPDNYSVSAQGVSGSFRPFYRRSFELFDGEEDDGKGQLRSLSDARRRGDRTTEGFVYRFLDDPGGNLVSLDAEDLKQVTFDKEYEGGRDRLYPEGVQPDEWFGSRRVEPIFAESGWTVVGFRVTDPSGKVYRFERAVRSLFEFSYTEDDDPDLEEPLVKTKTKHTAYPTQWLLTSVEGPDYVDREPLGVRGPEDWGYWVTLSYDETDLPRLWRTPEEGKTVSPVDEDVKTYSYGIREEVYLSRIETATHYAVFNREDAKHRYIPSGRDWVYQVPTDKFEDEENGFNDEGRDAGSRKWEFSFRGDWTDFVRNATAGTMILGVDNDCTGFSYDTTTGIFTREVRVDDNIPPSEVRSVRYENGYTYITVSTGDSGTDRSCAKLFVENLLKEDYMSGQKLTSVELKRRGTDRTVKTVRFDYDYRLRPNSPGSKAAEADGAKGGTLTLRTVSFEGRGKTTILPPYRFAYAPGADPGKGRNPRWQKEKWDRWGSYRGPTSSDVGDHQRSQKKEEADRADAWNLTQIRTPTGATVSVDYESDDYWHVQRVHDISKTQRLIVDGPQGRGNDQNTRQIRIPAGSQTSRALDEIRAEKGWRMLFLRRGRIIDYQQVTEGGIAYCRQRTLLEPNDLKVPTARTITGVTRKDDAIILTLNEPVELRSSFSGKPGGDDPCANYPEQETWTHFAYPVPDRTYGGGVRVRSLTTRSGLNTTRTVYRYTRSDGRSSGVATSLPNTHSGPGDLFAELRRGRFREYDNVFVTSELGYGRPSPSVIYGRVDAVNVDENETPISGTTRYRFYTAYDKPYETPGSRECTLCSFADYSSIYGRPKSTTYFELKDDGSERPVKKEETLYAFGSELAEYGRVQIQKDTDEGGLQDVPDDAPLGLSQEQYEFVNEDGIQNENRTVSSGGQVNENPRRAEMRHRYENIYPLGTSTTEYTYGGENGGNFGRIDSDVRHFAWDARTGNHTATATQASDGSAMVTKTTPAHWVYRGMLEDGLLLQQAQSMTYRPDALDVTDAGALTSYDFDPDDLIGGTVTTWSNAFEVRTAEREVTDADGAVWRKNDAYRYVPDADGDTYSPFTAWDAGLDAAYPRVTATQPWEMTKNVTAYDKYSHPIELRMEDDTYAARVYGYEGAKMVASVRDARASQVVAMSFENLPGEPFTESLADLRPDIQYREAPDRDRRRTRRTAGEIASDRGDGIEDGRDDIRDGDRDGGDRGDRSQRRGYYERTPPDVRLQRWKASGSGTFRIRRSSVPAGIPSGTARHRQSAHQGQAFLQVTSSGETAALKTNVGDLENARYLVQVWARGDAEVVLDPSEIQPRDRPQVQRGSSSSNLTSSAATVTAQPVAQTGGWTLYEGRIRYPFGFTVSLGVEPGGSADFDAVRVHPVRARMQTFDYHPLTHQVTAITGVNNRTTYFDYDDAGRLIRVRDRDGNARTRHRYFAAHFSASRSTQSDNRLVLDASQSFGDVREYRWDFGAEERTTDTPRTEIDPFGLGPVTLELIDAEGRVRASITRQIRPGFYFGYANDDSGGGEDDDGVCDDFEVGLDCSGTSKIICTANPLGGGSGYSFEWDVSKCKGLDSPTCKFTCSGDGTGSLTVYDGSACGYASDSYTCKPSK